MNSESVDLIYLDPPFNSKKAPIGSQAAGASFKDFYVCGGCGEHFLKRNLTVDHIVPRTAGGTDHPDNLWLLCAACNSSKGTRSQVEFLRDRISKRWEVPAWLLSTRGGDRLFEARG